MTITVGCMREFYFSISLLLISQFCFAQTEGTNFAKISNKILKHEIASFNIAHGFEATDTIKKKEVNEIPLLNCSDSLITFSAEGLKISISSTRFDSSRHKLWYDSQSYLKLIDGKSFWGTDGGVPNEEVKEVNVTIGNKRFLFPIDALKGIYQPNFCTKNNLNGDLILHSKVFRSTDKRRIYVYMLNSDGAGGYEVIWIIQDKKYLTRVIDFGF